MPTEPFKPAWFMCEVVLNGQAEPKPGVTLRDFATGHSFRVDSVVGSVSEGRVIVRAEGAPVDYFALNGGET